MDNIRDHYNKQLSSLKNERESFIGHYQELSQFIKPRRGRFMESDRNKGDKRYQSIINSVATQAHKIATAGMLAGTISPARPWFALETHDPGMMERQEVKDWLDDVERTLRAIFNQSNFYGQAPALLGELLLFGTGAMSHVDDFENVARFYTHTAGSYMIAQNDRYEVDTVYREFEWTVKQIVDAFGLPNVSDAVKNSYDKGNYGAWFPVCHAVEPNGEYKPSGILSIDKPFRSVYFEPGNTGPDKNKLLSQSGFDEFPLYVPRWELTDGDIYGTDCPGMTALGDVKGLQIMEKRKAQAVDKMVAPPLTGPASLRNSPVNSLPGGLVLYDGDDGKQQLRPIYEVKPQLSDLRVDMDAVEQRINKAFFVDMFLAITNMEGIQPRNQLDLMQRNEERLLQLGPVLERIHSEWLGKLIDRSFSQASKAGIFPPPPAILQQGEELRVKYISSLAMAQRAVATQGIERVASFAGNLYQLGFQDAHMKFNGAQAVDEYARAIGVPPSIIRSDEEVDAMVQQQQQQQAAQQGIVAAQGAADVAKTVSETKLDGRNLLSQARR